MASRRVLAVCGPSGVGKGTIVGLLLRDYPREFGLVTSHTTRLPREGEIPGEHYHFVDDDQFKTMIQQGAFVEHAHVHGKRYGTSVQALSDVMAKDKVCVMDIDVQGIGAMWKLDGSEAKVWDELVCAAVLPQSKRDLAERLASRGSETDESLSLRAANAAAEIEFFEASTSKIDISIVNTDSWKVGYPSLRCFLRDEKWIE